MTTSAERLQQLESQLSGLEQVKPKNQKERKKLEQEKETLTRTVASLKAYLALSINEKVTDGQKFGVIISKTLSPGGMPMAWVSWYGAVEIPEQPERLTVIKPPSYAIGEKPQLPQDAPTIASLFTGGGLFEVGALAAGFRPIWGIEHDPDNPDFSRQIADSYEQNFGGHIIRKSVQEVAQGGFKHLERPTVLHVSQPCKSFSAANSKTESETDLSAARAVQQAIRELQPPIITVENVTSYRDSQSWQLIRETLTHLGYSIKEAVVNAADYGVPQKRQRFLAYAVQNRSKEDGSNFRLLTSPLGGGKGGVDFRLPPMGWLEAIADLIPTLPQSQLADWQKERMPSIQPGKAYLIERTGARKDRDLLVHPGNEPSWTIKANIATDHKGANRHDPLNALLPDGKVVSLDARAIARLQSVPDWYELPELIGVAVTLIGNGVPCLLAQRLMETLSLNCLKSENSAQQGSSSGDDQSLNRINRVNPVNPALVWLALDEIRRDGGTQPRVKMDMAHIKRLEEQIEEGQQLEPVVVFHDGESNWLSDGFHRWQAHSNQEQEAIACTIHQGSRRDAILYSVGANADHKPALPRSRQDKRRAVLTLLQDPSWSTWSDREIARQCKVDHKTVGKIRQSLTGDFPNDNSPQSLTGDFPSNNSLQSLTGELSSEERTYTTKHGTIATMKTANIGKSQSPPTSEFPEPTELAAVQSTSHPESKQLREGLNYHPGNGCEHYVKVEQATWEQLKQYQEEVGTATLDGALARMLSERTPKPVPTDELCLAITSNVDKLNDQQLLAVVKAIAHLNPDLIRQVLDSPEELVKQP